MPRGGKRSEADVEQLAIAAALRRWERHQPPAEIVAELGLRDDRELRRLLRRAVDRQSPLVVVRVHKIGHDRKTDPVFNDRLAAAGSLGRALVAVIDPPDPALDKADLSNELHRQVGQVAARYFLQSLRPYDVVALGAGRGVGSTIEALAGFPDKRSYPELRLLSLTGGGLVRSKSDRLDRFIDADEAIVELSVQLNVRPSGVFRVQLPIGLADRDQIVPGVAPHLADRPWDPKPPDIVLIGLGILNPGHNIMMMTGPVVRSIEAEIKELQDKVLSEVPDSVVDICNTFFVRRGVLTESTEREAHRLVKALNSKIVTAPLRRINEAREKIVVGAGMEKVPVWLEMLRNADKIGFRPTVVITDEETGRELVERLEKDDGAD